MAIKRDIGAAPPSQLKLLTGPQPSDVVCYARIRQADLLHARYLGHDAEEDNPASNPGHPYIRIALVADEATTETALRRLAACL